MRIGRTSRLRLPGFNDNRGMWFGVLAIAALFVSIPAYSQGPVGAAAVAAGAGAAATASAPAPPPKKSATEAATAAASMGNSDVAPTETNNTARPPANEEAANGAAPAISAAELEKIVTGPLPKDVPAQCANLLKLATGLKAEVDKTTKDVLSVAVIRDAGAIEEMAHKMREGQH